MKNLFFLNSGVFSNLNDADIDILCYILVLFALSSESEIFLPNMPPFQTFLEKNNIFPVKKVEYGYKIQKIDIYAIEDFFIIKELIKN